MMHLLNFRCPECSEVFQVRRPNKAFLVSKVLPFLKCPKCYPKQKDMCAGCRLPLSIIKRRVLKVDLCLACFWKEWNWNKQDRRYKKRT